MENMSFAQAMEQALDGKAIYRRTPEWHQDAIVFVEGRAVTPSFGVMVNHLGKDQHMYINNHLDGIKFTSHDSCSVTVGVTLTQEDLLRSDWACVDDARDIQCSLFAEPVSMTQ
jgi:hypothetical protein